MEGRVVIDIDWQKHEALASTTDGKYFKLDPNKKISTQLSEIYDLLVEYVNYIKQDFNVQTIQVQFQFLDEIYRDEDMYQEAQRFLNTRSSNPPNWAKPKNSRGISYDEEMEFVYNRLQELHIRVERNKRY